MKTIIIFGASGRTGRALAAEAKARGIETRAFDKRSPSVEELRRVVQDADASVIVFGPTFPYKDIFCAETTKNIVHAMESEGARRLICQTGAMIGDYRGNRSFFFERFSAKFRKSNPKGYEDRVGQERAIKNSSLEWTIIKPPRLTADERERRVRAGENIKVGVFSSISRKSLARFIIGELLAPRYVRRAVFVKN